MQGKRIAEPMRYLCSALLAIVAALFLNLFLRCGVHVPTRQTADR